MRRTLIVSLIALGLLSCRSNVSFTPARGVDLGWLSEMEHDSMSFYTESGEAIDCIDLMQDLGADAVRLRVWVNHSTGWCNKEDVLAMARRVKAHGMRLMIDFHYSDYWADPQQQNIPDAWTQLNEEELCLAIGAHTVDVLHALQAEGITPTWVQIGNETTYGMLWPIGRLHVDPNAPYGSDQHWRTYAHLSNSGYEAVKQVFPHAICITHVDNAFIPRVPWFERFRAAGGKWDMIGLSHYPFTQDSIAPLEMNRRAIANIRALDSVFHCPVMVVEIGTASWLPDSALTVMQDFVAATCNLPGYAGAFYWEPECYGGWRPAEYIPLGWGAYGMGCMTDDGRPTETIRTLLKQ